MGAGAVRRPGSIPHSRRQCPDGRRGAPPAAVAKPVNAIGGKTAAGIKRAPGRSDRDSEEEPRRRGGDMAEADDFKIELFIFPDGTAVEIIVFDRQGVPAASHAGACRAVGIRAPRRRTARHGQKRRRRLHRRAGARSVSSRTRTSARSAAAPSSTPSTGRARTMSPGASRCAAPSARPGATSSSTASGVEQFNRELYLGAQARRARGGPRVPQQLRGGVGEARRGPAEATSSCRWTSSGRPAAGVREPHPGDDDDRCRRLRPP